MRESDFSEGTTVGHLRIGQVTALPLLWCPLEEQKRIVAYINVESGPLNSAIARFEREIELLREYRTRLIADVVTGKLDVRAVAARLPDESIPEEIAMGDANVIDEEEAADVEAAA